MTERYSRRAFIHTAVGATAAGWAAVGLVSAAPAGAAATKRRHLATNGYPWQTFYRRAGKDFGAALDAALGEVAAAGFDGFEGSAGGPEEVERLAPLLKKHKLEMRSLYVNSTLHEPAQVEASIVNILRIAEKARACGTQILVTNPNPIRWGGPENKSDAQLRTQAAALNRLGKALKAAGFTLAYHFHDIELRMAARELHHMMVGTDPELVTMCLDAHWVYRGAGNSEVAVFDIAALYAKRIREIHLRQSKGGVWTEAFGPGDIDYARLFKLAARWRPEPLLVLEQAVEKDSPDTLDVVQAHRQGVEYTRRLLASREGGQ